MQFDAVDLNVFVSSHALLKTLIVCEMIDQLLQYIDGPLRSIHWRQWTRILVAAACAHMHVLCGHHDGLRLWLWVRVTSLCFSFFAEVYKYQDPPGVLTLFEWVLFPLWFFKVSCFIVIIKLKLGVSGVFSVFLQHYMYQTWMCVLQIHSLLLRRKKGKLL